MNKEIKELRKTADELMETAEELFKTAREMENTDESEQRRRPAINNNYWYIDCRNKKCRAGWEDDDTDEARFNNLNTYLIEEECDEQIVKKNALNKIKTYILDNFGDWKPDWEDFDQSKWNVYYCHKIKKLTVFLYFYTKSSVLIPYLEKREQIEQLISDCESELITLLK